LVARGTQEVGEALDLFDGEREFAVYETADLAHRFSVAQVGATELPRNHRSQTVAGTEVGRVHRGKSVGCSCLMGALGNPLCQPTLSRAAGTAEHPDLSFATAMNFAKGRPQLCANFVAADQRNAAQAKETEPYASELWIACGIFASSPVVWTGWCEVGEPFFVFFAGNRSCLHGEGVGREQVRRNFRREIEGAKAQC